MAIKISEIERLLCGPATGDLGRLIQHPGHDPWKLDLADLSALPQGDQPWRPLRFCIATEDIAGPVRNGGIGTTYAHLAEMLAKMGHESTILYLKGDQVETGDLPYWVNHYAERGVRFTPVPDYAAKDRFRSHADRWMKSPYNMMRWLEAHPMDVVHVSEWRGCGYLSLAAKRQGVAFADTLFLVKTSSPWMWNRLYGAEALERIDDLAKIHAERRSVELGDVVIGGSIHLLRWMSSQGYRLPAERTFVQPNVISFEDLAGLMGRRQTPRGSRMPFDEFVFFGRLEGRKGLAVFCQAIERMIRLGVTLPPKITFMGKEGRRLTSRPDLSVMDYIAQATSGWPTQVKVITDYQQYEALEYLLDGPRLAVMPSVIENSSMAVYEAAILGIPCVASDVGGNSELVAETDWPEIFCDPHPLSLGDKLAEAVQFGGYVPSPSFDNDANLETWRRFHDALARGLREHLLQAADSGLSSRPARRAQTARVVVPAAPAAYPPPDPLTDRRPGLSAPAPRRKVGLGLFAAKGPAVDDDQAFVRALAARESERRRPPPEPADTEVEREPAAATPTPAAFTALNGKVSVCVYAAGAPSLLRETLASVLRQSAPPADVVVVVDADRREHFPEIQRALDLVGHRVRAFEAFDLDAGAAFNRAAQQAEGDLLVFLWEGAVLKPEALSVLTDVAERCGADVLTFMHRAGPDGTAAEPAGALCAQLVTGSTDAFFRQDVAPAPLAVTRAAFERLDGFTEDHRVLGHDAELIAKAQINGLTCETVMLELGASLGPSAEWIARRGYDLPASRFRLIRPLLAAAPLASRDLLLMAKGLQTRAVAAPSAKVKPGGRSEGLDEPFARMMKAILAQGGRGR
jgi:glycosyltransferase involved in cell wall biosynthesis